MSMIEFEDYGRTRDGKQVFRYTLTNDAGMEVKLLSYACAIQSITVPKKDGTMVDVVLGYDDLAGYEAGSCFFGAFVGRYANRIKGAQFTLDGTTYRLPANDGPNHLHGVMAHQVFDSTCFDVEDGVTFYMTSPAGEEGFPGNLNVEVFCYLTEENELVLEYYAETDAPTVVNFTNHTYFNLNGQDGSDILSHKLTLSADRFTEGDAETLPTGRILPVDGTVMDFRDGKQIGADFGKGDEQLALAHGYDHNFILPDASDESDDPRWFASAEANGIRLDAFTDQPAVQLYTGQFVCDDAAPCGKNGVRYPAYGGFCLETQHYPCSPNFPRFPSTVLRPGELYRFRTVYRFTAL